MQNVANATPFAGVSPSSGERVGNTATRAILWCSLVLPEFPGKWRVTTRLQRTLAKHDATLENIDKVVTYVTDIRYFFEAGKCRGEFFGSLTPPAGTFVAVTALAWPGMLIEVDVTASTPK